MVARGNSSAAAAGRPLTSDEEDAIGDALAAEAAEEQPVTPPVPSEAPLSPAERQLSDAKKREKAQTITAKVRQEQRTENEKDANAAEFERALSLLLVPGAKYKFSLMRLKPVSYKDPDTGLTYIPGKDDGIGKLVTTYSGEDPPTLDEIADTHGGEEYKMRVVGPSKDDPNRSVTRTIPLPAILGPPKTLGTANGALPFGHATQFGLAPPVDNTAATVTTTMMTMVEKMQAQSRQDMMTLVQTLQKANVPITDPQADKRWQEEQAEKKRNHEAQLAKEKLEAEERREAAKVEREERIRREDREREERREEAKRQHDKEMKLLDQQAEDRRAEDKRRREDEERREKRHEELLKEQRQGMEKLVDKITKKEENPTEQILRNLDLVDRIRGDKGEKEDSALSKAVPELLKTVRDLGNTAMTRFGNQPSAPSKTQTVAPAKKDTVLIAETTSAPTQTAEASAPGPDDGGIGLKWPDPEVVERYSDEDKAAIGKLFGDNLDKALAAQWNAKRIWNEIVVRFPMKMHVEFTSYPMDLVLSAAEHNSPDGSYLKTPVGKQALRMIYKGLKKQIEDQKKEAGLTPETPAPAPEKPAETVTP